MKFKRVFIFAGQVFICCNCGASTSIDVWADLNGEAFRAYYCQECKEKLEEGGLEHEKR